jgi:hypothetical protein
MMKVIPETRFGFGFERTLCTFKAKAKTSFWNNLHHVRSKPKPKRVSGITFIMYVQSQSQNEFLE